MNKKVKKTTAEWMLIDSSQQSSVRVTILDQNREISDLFFENNSQSSIRHNVYLATVTRVEPSLEAAFVDYGGERNGFLPYTAIHPDYFQIPKETNSKSSFSKRSDRSDDKESKNKESENYNEQLDSDIEETEEYYRNRKQQNQLHKKYEIQDVIKRGQNILIQVCKDSRGTKGVSCTTYISLIGRYSILLPNSPQGIGVSRKIADPLERKRLINAVKQFALGDEISVVVRTAGESVLEEEIKRDYEYLANLWNEIRKKTLNSKTASIIYNDSSVIKQVIRDNYSETIKKVIVEGSAYEEVTKVFAEFLPQERVKVVHYEDKIPMLVKYGVEDRIYELLQERVSLPSGGYLIINQTEALVSIDVNSGKGKIGKDVEEMALQTNLEASREIARQLRLRELGGLVVIDFIDMTIESNRREVENEMRIVLEPGRARVQIGKISGLGLMQLSRQRTRSSLMELVTLPCLACCGTGRIRSGEFVANAIVRSLNAVIRSVKKGSRVIVECSPIVHQFIIGHGDNNVVEVVRKKTGVDISMVEDESIATDGFIIREKVYKGDRLIDKILINNPGCAVDVVAKDLSASTRFNRHNRFNKNNYQRENRTMFSKIGSTLKRLLLLR